MEKLVLVKLILATPWLIWLSVCDFSKRELPNGLTLGGAAVMAVLALAVNVNYLLGSLVTAFLVSLFLLLPFFLRAAGAGDVKMLFAAGLTAGPGNTLNLILLVSKRRNLAEGWILFLLISTSPGAAFFPPSYTLLLCFYVPFLF